MAARGQSGGTSSALVLDLQSLRQPATEIGIHHGEVLDRTLLEERRGVAQMTGDVVDQPLAGGIVQHAPIEDGRLGEVVLVARLDTLHVARHLPRRVLQLVRTRARVGSVERVREVVRRTALVVGAVHWTVALEVAGGHAVRAVHRQHQVVGAHSVAVGVSVREQARLQHLVRRRFDAGHQVGRRERGLLHLGEVVARVAIEHHAADGDQRELALRPHLGQIERIERHLLGLLERHHLELERPAGEVLLRDRVVQIADAVVRIGSGQLVGARHVHVLNALIRLEVELAVHRLALGVDQLERVRTVPVHEPVAVRDAAVREQEHHLMRRFRAQRDKVPEHVRILQVRRRVALLRVDEAREQHRIADEEYWRVVAHHIPHAVVGVELDGETARIAGRVGRAALTADGREAYGERRLLADRLKYLRRTVLRDVVRHLEVAEGAGALGVDHTLRNALAVEVGQLVDQVHVLQQDRAARAHRLRGRLRTDRAR
uniref:Uncharacterized protein n=1 Tax=Anopheles atroparvus TaxID=41427 RepID=A0A182JAW5_ANOAO